MRALVLSDTHIRRGGTRRLPDEVYEELAAADVVLHAGDVMVREVLDELSGFAPVHAVLGNNDDGELAALLPETLVLDLDGVVVGMIHDSGRTNGRAARMRARFPSAAVVVYGHSHIPFLGPGADGQLLFNPGSTTERRMQPRHTYGVLECSRGRILRSEIVAV